MGLASCESEKESGVRVEREGTKLMRLGIFFIA